MAEENQNSSQEKTEQPTQRRIDKAKEDPNVCSTFLVDCAGHKLEFSQ